MNGVRTVGKAVAFPGQGIQYLGMAEPLRKTPAWHLFEEASVILGYNLAELLCSGPEEKLHQTEYAQPAVFVTCFALWEFYKGQLEPELFLGHSLGEITAFAAAGAFSFADGVRLAAARGKFMGELSGGMLAVIGLDEETLAQICRKVSQTHFVSIANLNCPGQVVLSGVETALEQATGLALEQGARRAVPLKVSGPFHTELMAPAAQKLQEYITSIEMQDISIPVISNHRNEPVYKGEDIKAELVEQLTQPVRFAENVLKAAQLGIDTLVEMSPKAVIGPMARRTLGTLKISLATPGGI